MFNWDSPWDRKLIAKRLFSKIIHTFKLQIVCEGGIYGPSKHQGKLMKLNCSCSWPANPGEMEMHFGILKRKCQSLSNFKWLSENF